MERQATSAAIEYVTGTVSSAGTEAAFYKKNGYQLSPAGGVVPTTYALGMAMAPVPGSTDRWFYKKL